MKAQAQTFSEEILRKIFGSQLILDRRFQLKYTLSILSAVIGATVPIVLICLYFVNHNYNTFIELALSHSPELTNHLVRERTWVNLCVISFLFGGLVFAFFFGLKITYRLIAPILIVREHLKTLSRGQWNAPDVIPTPDEEYYDLVEAYHYFYKSLRHLTKSEIERLNKLKPFLETTEPDSFKILNELIVEKSNRLDLKTAPHD